MATYGHAGGYAFNEDQRGGHHPTPAQGEKKCEHCDGKGIIYSGKNYAELCPNCSSLTAAAKEDP